MAPRNTLAATDSNRLNPPSAAHWFGTDEMGNDLFTRVVVATRTSLYVGLVIVIVASTIGVPLGIAAGYFGGRTRMIIMRVTDVFLSVPGLVLALAIVAALGAGILNGIIALSIVWWPGYVRLVEAKALSLRGESYVEAARSLGASQFRILAVHIFPNCLSPIIIKASMDMGLAILSAASLGFIGLGARPPAPEYYFGLGIIPQDYQQAQLWFEKAAEQGDASAMYFLGSLYEDNLVVSQDYPQAKEWYEKAAEKGDASAMENLGKLYEHGLGVPKDPKMAKHSYDKAEQQKKQ